MAEQTKVDDGGPAFPCEIMGETLVSTRVQGQYFGLTIRQYLAAKAMAALWLNEDVKALATDVVQMGGYTSVRHAIAVKAYQMADTMIEVGAMSPPPEPSSMLAEIVDAAKAFFDAPREEHLITRLNDVEWSAVESLRALVAKAEGRASC